MKLVSPDMQRAGEVAYRFAQDAGTPIQAMLEISDRCNEVCVHCYQEQGQKGEMDTAELLSLLDELASQGVLFLTISGGEPTLRKDFLQVVDHAYQLGFVMRIFTNGLSMTPEMAQALHAAAVEAVEISVYSHRAETHDFVTGVKGSFERTLAGIRALVAAGVMVVIKAPVMSLNEAELEAYVAMAKELGAHHAFAPGHLHPKEGGARDHQMFSRSDGVYRELMARANAAGDLPKAKGAVRKREDQRPCGAGGSVHVEPNGQLRPCTLLEVDLGSVRPHGVARAREQSAELAGIRSLTWQDLHGCRECDLSAFCGHCYAHALSETGDALGPYPSACREAKTSYEVTTGKTSDQVATDSDRPEPTLGPFRVLANGRCESKPDQVTEADRALAQRLGWTQRKEGPVPSVSALAKPGELVQLRRPGGKRPTSAQVPAHVEATSVTRSSDTTSRLRPGD